MNPVLLWIIAGSVLCFTEAVFPVAFVAMPVRSTKLKQSDAIAGETLTAIEPGQTGRVLYEGNSWRAECEDQEITIAASQKVYVVGRKGNTLIVYPILD